MAHHEDVGPGAQCWSDYRWRWGAPTPRWIDRGDIERFAPWPAVAVFYRLVNLLSRPTRFCFDDPEHGCLPNEVP